MERVDQAMKAKESQVAAHTPARAARLTDDTRDAE